MARERKFALGSRETRKFLVSRIQDTILDYYWKFEEHGYNFYDLFCKSKSGQEDKVKVAIFDYYPYWASDVDDLFEAKKWLENDFIITANKCLKVIPKIEYPKNACDSRKEAAFGKYEVKKALLLTVIDKELKELKCSWKRRNQNVDPPIGKNLILTPPWKS